MEHCGHDFLVDLFEEYLPPLHEMKRVDVVNVLLPLIYFPLDPVSVEVAEQVIDVVGGGRVSVPLPDVKAEQRFLFVSLTLREDFFEVVGEVISEVLVKVFTK